MCAPCVLACAFRPSVCTYADEGVEARARRMRVIVRVHGVRGCTPGQPSMVCLWCVLVLCASVCVQSPLSQYGFGCG